MAKQGPLLGSFEGLARYLSLKSDGSVLESMEDFIQPTLDVIGFNSIALESIVSAVSGATPFVANGSSALTGAGGLNGTNRMGPEATSKEIWLVHGFGVSAGANATALLGITPWVTMPSNVNVRCPVSGEGLTTITGGVGAVGAFLVGFYRPFDPLVLLPGMLFGYQCNRVTDSPNTNASFEMLFRRYNSA